MLFRLRAWAAFAFPGATVTAARSRPVRALHGVTACPGWQPSTCPGVPRNGTVEGSWGAESVSQICGSACPGVTKIWATVCAVTRLSPETPANAAFPVMIRGGHREG